MALVVSYERGDDMLEKWEYKILGFSFIPGKEPEAPLNQLGQQGWELVAVTMPSEFSGIYSCMAYFKRKTGASA